MNKIYIFASTLLLIFLFFLIYTRIVSNNQELAPSSALSTNEAQEDQSATIEADIYNYTDYLAGLSEEEVALISQDIQYEPFVEMIETLPKPLYYETLNKVFQIEIHSTKNGISSGLLTKALLSNTSVVFHRGSEIALFSDYERVSNQNPFNFTKVVFVTDLTLSSENQYDNEDVIDLGTYTSTIERDNKGYFIQVRKKEGHKILEKDYKQLIVRLNMILEDFENYIK
ncbi:MAG: hypothetical protein Kow0081_2570 [Candidatus Dojkabacteria bacterium]